MQLLPLNLSVVKSISTVALVVQLDCTKKKPVSSELQTLSDSNVVSMVMLLRDSRALLGPATPKSTKIKGCSLPFPMSYNARVRSLGDSLMIWLKHSAYEKVIIQDCQYGVLQIAAVCKGWNRYWNVYLGRRLSGKLLVRCRRLRHKSGGQCCSKHACILEPAFTDRRSAFLVSRASNSAPV